MGLGSQFRRALSRADSSVTHRVKTVLDDPFSTKAFAAASPLIVGFPTGLFAGALPSDLLNLADKSGRKIDQITAKPRREIARPIEKGKRGLVTDLRRIKKNRRDILVGSAYVGIIVGVIVVCLFTWGTGCVPAVTAGMGALTTLYGVDSGYQAETKMKEAERKAREDAAAANAADAHVYSIDGQATEQGSFGDASGALANGDFSGVGDSFDMNTMAGKKTWIVIGGIVASSAALFYLVKYVRK